MAFSINWEKKKSLQSSHMKYRNSYRSWDPCPCWFYYQNVWCCAKCCRTRTWSKYQHLPFLSDFRGTSDTFRRCCRPRSSSFSRTSHDGEYVFSVWPQELFLSWSPMGYQITQLFHPSQNMVISMHFVGRQKRFKICRIHIEADAGGSKHSISKSLVDFNRAGESADGIVTEPDFRGKKMSSNTSKSSKDHAICRC